MRGWSAYETSSVYRTIQVTIPINRILKHEVFLILDFMFLLSGTIKQKQYRLVPTVGPTLLNQTNLLYIHLFCLNHLEFLSQVVVYILVWSE